MPGSVSYLQYCHVGDGGLPEEVGKESLIQLVEVGGPPETMHNTPNNKRSTSITRLVNRLLQVCYRSLQIKKVQKKQAYFVRTNKNK